MDPKYFILSLFLQFLNNPFFSETEAIPTEKPPQSTLFTSIPLVSNSQSTTENSSVQSTQSNTSTEITAGQPAPMAYNSSGKPAVLTSGGPPVYNITGQLRPVANTSFPQTVLPVFTSTRPQRPHIYTSTQQLPVVTNSSSGKQVLQTGNNVATQPTPAIYLPSTTSFSMNTPPFISESTNKKETPNKAKYNAIAAILIGVILICMLIAIIMAVLWKRLRKSVLNDQNWAGRSPFADGETPDICMDNIRENEVPTKRTSIVSLMTWKPSKNTLLADDFEVKLFESSENIDANLKAESIRGKVNGTSEDSADRSTIGTAVSSSDDADLPPPPPLLDLEGQERDQSDQPTITTVSPLPNDSAHLQPPLDSLNQTLEDSNSEIKQQFPPDSCNLPLPPTDFIQNRDSTQEIQCQEFSILPASDQDLSKSLPPPPTELL